MSRLTLRNALRNYVHKNTNIGGDARSTRDIFDFWMSDGEMGNYPPYPTTNATDTGTFDYRLSDGEYPQIESK